MSKVDASSYKRCSLPFAAWCFITAVSGEYDRDIGTFNVDYRNGFPVTNIRHNIEIGKMLMCIAVNLVRYISRIDRE